MSRHKPNQILKEWPSYPAEISRKSTTTVKFELQLLLFGLNMELHRPSTGTSAYYIHPAWLILNVAGGRRPVLRI